MKKKIGFTLIELLAIIVILAILSLIAIPIVINVINKVRKSAFHHSHSQYGTNKQVRINNNSQYVTGCAASTEMHLYMMDVKMHSIQQQDISQVQQEIPMEYTICQVELGNT